MEKKRIFYIADFSLPNMSAYTLHVLKMCDAFSEEKYSVKLLIPFMNTNYKFSKIKKDYLLKNFFKIKNFFSNKYKRNFFFFFILFFKNY